MTDVRKQVRDLILDLKNPDKWDYTGYVTLDVVDGKRWAIVIGWMDGFDDEGTADYKRDDYRLCGKVAYQSANSVMQEYDYDWLMPYDKDAGEVWDTDTSIESDSNIDSCIDWWLSEWEEIKKEYVYPEEDYDEDIESSTKSNYKKITASYSSYDDLLDEWKEQVDQRWDMMDDEERAEYNNDYLEYLDSMNGVSFTEEDFRHPIDRSSYAYDIKVGRSDPMYLSDEDWKKLEHYFHHEIYDEIAAESVYKFLQDKLDELPDAPW